MRNWSGGCKQRFWWVWLTFGGKGGDDGFSYHHMLLLC